MIRRTLFFALLVVAGCAPSEDARENRKSFEFLLTAVSLKNPKELEKDAQRIDDRHAAGKLSDARYRELKSIIDKARAGQWGEAERMAYEFREAQPYFK